MSLLLQKIQRLLGSEGVGGLLGVLSEFQSGSGGDVTAAVADAEGVGAGLGEPLTACFVERGKVTHRNGHRERLTLTGLQLASLGKGFQFLSGLL